MSNRFPSIRIESSLEGPPGAGEVAREGPREDGLDEGDDVEPARDGGREPKSGIFRVVVEVSLRSGDPKLGDNFGKFPRNWLRHISRRRQYSEKASEQNSESCAADHYHKHSIVFRTAAVDYK
jgi:hypothetical protein